MTNTEQPDVATPAPASRAKPATPVRLDAGQVDEITVRLDAVEGRLFEVVTLLTQILTELAEPDAPVDPVLGTFLVKVTGVPVQLGAADVGAVVVQALPTNSANVEVGTQAVSSANGYVLQPGQAVGVIVDNLRQLSVVGTAGDGVCVIGS